MSTTTFIVQIFGKIANDVSLVTGLDSLAEEAAELLFGKGSEVRLFVTDECHSDIQIKRIDMELSCACLPERVKSVAEESEAGVEDVLSTIIEVLRLGKFSSGRKAAVSFKLNERGQVKVTNSAGQIQYFDPIVVELYNRQLNRLSISTLTKCLDLEGVGSIRIFTGDDDESAVVFDKKDRAFFRCDDGKVLTENESGVFLEIVAPMLNGAAEGWRFSEGQGGLEFTATVEDAEFLEKVRIRDIDFAYGVGVYAIVRTVQRKAERTDTTNPTEIVSNIGATTVTERTIVKIVDYYYWGQPY